MVKHISIKKTLALIAAFLLVMVTMASGVSAKTSDISSTNTELSFSLELSPTRVRKGETFYAIVKVDNRTSNPVSNASFSIRYNSEHVTFAGLSNGNSCYAVSEKRQVSGSTYEITATFTATDFATSLKANTESTCDIRFAFTCAQGYSSDQTSPMTLENVSAHCRENIVSSGSAKYTFDSSRIVAGSANVTLASLSSDNTLNALTFLVNGASVDLDPVFTPANTSYILVLPYNNPGFEVKFSLADTTGATFVKDFPTSLKVGNNPLHITVTAENGSKKTYSVNVIRLPKGGTVSSYYASLSSPASDVSSVDNGSSVPSDVSSLTTVTPSDVSDISSEPEIDTSEEPESDNTSEDEPGDEYEDGDDEDSSGLFPDIKINLGVVLGIILGEIALFAGAYAAGYMTHKNITKQRSDEDEEDEEDDYDEDDYE